MENEKCFEPVPDFEGPEAGRKFREAINSRLKALYDRIKALESEVAKNAADRSRRRRPPWRPSSESSES